MHFASHENNRCHGTRLLLEPVGLSCEAVREIGSDFVCFILVEAVLSDETRQKRAIDATRHIVSRGYRKKRAGVVIETHGIVKPRGPRGVLAKTHDAFRAVIEPPRGAQ